MDNKKLGIALILASLVFLVTVIIFKIQVSNLVESLMVETGGTCIKEGRCLHEQSNIPTYIGIALIFLLFSLGIYLIFFERSQEKVEKIQKEIVTSLKETKKQQDKNEKFEILLKALNEDEKKIMMAVKEQDGIEQATLRIRTDLSKTKLSVILSGLEKKSLLKKVPEGKKNKIYIKTAF